MIDRITNPLRLAVGTHKEGSGKGCAMNVISYINGDTKITDYPDCSAHPLARLVQVVNDWLAGPDGYLSPENSVVVLDLGFATMGTADASNLVVYAWLAELLDSPEWGVSQFSSGKALLAVTTAADLLRKSSNGTKVSVAEWKAANTNAADATAAYAAAYGAYAGGAVHAATNAAYACAVYAAYADDDDDSDAIYAAFAAVYASNAAANAVTTTNAANARVVQARQAIAAWRRLAGLDEAVADVKEVNSALEKMGAC